jgi:hypothetical protein
MAGTLFRSVLANEQGMGSATQGGWASRPPANEQRKNHGEALATFSPHWQMRARRPRSCERTYMKSTSESLSHPETSNGRAAEGNCVVVRRGGEQPEADLRSQTRVNPIRFTTAASLLASGEACRKSGNRFLPHPSSTGEKRVVGDGWCENAGKVSCGRALDLSGQESARAEPGSSQSRHSSDEAG